jgi:uncharacterized membrane protein YvbJ
LSVETAPLKLFVGVEEEVSMALTPCPACGKDVPNQAPTCPHCGHPIGGLIRVSPPQAIIVEQPKSAGSVSRWRIVLWMIPVAIVLLFLSCDLGRTALMVTFDTLLKTFGLR